MLLDKLRTSAFEMLENVTISKIDRLAFLSIILIFMMHCKQHYHSITHKLFIKCLQSLSQMRIMLMLSVSFITLNRACRSIFKSLFICHQVVLVIFEALRCRFPEAYR